MATAFLFDRDRVDEVNDRTRSLPKVGHSAISVLVPALVATLAVVSLAGARAHAWV